MEKIKVLMVNECSFLSTGYARYGQNLLSRLHQDSRFDVAEMGTFFNPTDNKANQVPWKFFANIPPGDFTNQKVVQLAQDKEFQMGYHLFSDIAMNFQASVIISITDFWGQKFINNSVYRKCFKSLWMAPHDAIPQNLEWIEDMINHDGVLGYTDWAVEEIKKVTDKVNLLGSAPPSAEPCFAPMNKVELKKSLGISPDTKFVGTVMRNQFRKLYPNLFSSFRRFLDESKREDVFLYCHTSYPDGSWNFPQLIQDYGIAHKVLFTYICKSCKYVFPSFYNDACTCKRCGHQGAVMPNTHMGVELEELAKVYNLMDCYVQYANCFAKGQKVSTIDGWKNIEDIKAGDSVLTHKGRYKNVVQTFSKTNNKQMLKISVHANPGLMNVTEEHPVLAYSQSCIKTTNKVRSFKEFLTKELKKGKVVPSFINAKDLQVGDILCKSINKEVIDVTRIDITERVDMSGYLVDQELYRHPNTKVCHTRYIDVDEDFCRFLGLYVTDGSMSGWSLKVTSHLNETDITSFCAGVMSKYGNVAYHPYNGRQALDVMVSNKPMCKLFLEWCKNHENKRLPEWVMTLPIEKQKQILIGMCLGDGHSCKDRDTTVYSTTSPTMARQVQNLAERIGINYSYYIKVRGGNRKNEHRFEFRKKIKNGEFQTTPTSTRGFITKDHFCYQIKSIEKVDYTGEVYNFEVEEDNSYVTECSSVHNCEGFGIPLVEAAKCGITGMATDYSAMSDVVRKVAGYPIKVLGYQTEVSTGCLRALPDDSNLVSLLLAFFKKPEPVRKIESIKTERAANKNYDWDKTAEVWKKAILSVAGPDMWKCPVKHHRPAEKKEMNYSNQEYAKWLIKDVAGRPEKLGSLMETILVRDLNYGMSTGYHEQNKFSDDSMLFNDNKLHPFSRDKAYELYHSIGEEIRLRELARAERFGL